MTTVTPDEQMLPIAAPTSPAAAVPEERTDASGFSSVSIGSEFDGVSVEFIYGADENYIVYEAKAQLFYQLEDAVKFRREVIDTFQEFTALVHSRLQGAYATHTRNLIGSALVRACGASTSEEVRKPFEIVADFIATHTPIGRVFDRSARFVVFLDHRGSIDWEYPEHPDAMLPYIAEFQKLNQTAMTVLEPEDQKAINHILGNELTVAFRSAGKAGTPAEVFSASRDFISKRLEASVSNRYVMASLIAAIFFGIGLLSCVIWPPTLLAKSARALALGAMAGMIGAFISVLQRSFSVVVTQFAPKSQVMSQAVVRMTLGMIFGALVVIAVKGNVAFGAFSTSTHALFLLAAAAGLSERFIPDFLTGLTTRGTSGGSPPAGGGGAVS